MAGDALLKTTCPHCGTVDIGFTSVAQILRERYQSGTSDWNVFFACNGCSEGVVALVSSTHSCGPIGLPDHVVIPGVGYASGGTKVGFHVNSVYPSPPAHNAPEFVPERIAAAFIESSENLHRGKNETSQMLSRKALDLATKRLLPESKKKLFGRIEELRDTGKITAEMADWAHIVRDEGNDSVHDEGEVTREAAAELLAFTETFLMYAFTLPGMIEKRRQPPDDGADAVAG